jgi:ataxia telangiectasia mutated family protein
MSVRLSLLRSQRRSFEASQMGDIPDVAALKIIEKETTTLLSLSQEARRASKLQIAMNSVTQAQQLSQDLTRSSVEEEFASLLWDLGDHATAIESLTNIVRARQADKSNGQQERDDLPLALALSRLGQWRATARSHQPRAIRDECFLPAYTLAVQSASTSMEEKASVFYQYAIFAHLQYQTLMKSPDGENLNAFIRYREEELEQLEVQMKKAPTQKIQRALEKTRKLKDMDSEKLNEFEKSKMRFRKEATKMYAVLLPITNAFDDKAVIRLVSLWFENADDQWVNKDLNAWLKNIPSRKFLPFVHQLSSRLSQRSGATASLPSTQIEANNYFQINVKEVVLRMCMEHPFHSLTPLYALTQADDDREGRIPAPRKSNALLSKASAPRASQGTVPIAQLLRKEAAADIIQRVAASHKQPSRIKEWKRVCDACMQWARFDLAIQMPAVFGAASDDGLPKTKAHLISANFNLSITRLQNLEVPVLTKHLPVDETCHYDEIVSITRYSDRFTTAGGVHLPKITDCIGSDGKTYKQLFKNLDDLRQDAVMQQVFGVLNSLLKTDREAKKRELRVRTYIVIPLGPRYGLLEFVGNTRPLQAPLLATHAKYRRKGDITPREARAQLAENEFKKGSREQRADLFEKVGQSLPPTFRFHFLERHKIPMTLLTNRLNYTRSVATTSIVGHILGLGDRHVSNILLDDLTGEVIHIDFGVAFDQGKLLPIPELVPFRLTRDMVDAMGLHGVEGVYRRCCQETLRVMREGASVIETVLQVFKYDPLYDWTQNPVKVIRAQHDQTSTGDPSSSHNSSTLDATANHRRFLQHQKASPELNGGGKDVAELLAERAIGTVMEKLSTSLSVEYTVNDLMMQARDPANLGSIFSGWQAAL